MHVARWNIDFPVGKLLDRWELWAYWKGILEAGEREAVYRVVETEEPYKYEASVDGAYVPYMEKLLQKTQEHVPQYFRHLRGGPYRTQSGALITPARLAYYGLDGDLVEAEVADMGALLQQLRTDISEWDRDYMAHKRPLELYGNPGVVREGEDGRPYTRQTYLTITLDTDIWFPKVRGFLHKRIADETWEGSWYEKRPSQEWYDNSELASHHTPRFNRFMATVKQLTLEFSGQIVCDKCDDCSATDDQWNEDGIILD
jgi:hypothetical protein